MSVSTNLILGLTVAGAAATIAGAIDPVTIRCDRGDQVITVRLAGLTAPRGNGPRGATLARELSAEIERRWSGRQVLHLRGPADGAVLRLDDGRILNEEIVREGLAFADGPALLAFEREARIGQRGLWNVGSWQRRRSAVLEARTVDSSQEQPREPGLAERLDQAQLPPWEQRRQAFEADLAALSRRSADQAPETER